MVILCDWGEKVLKDLIPAGVSTNYTSKRYISCRQVITRILYHALGMTDHLVEVANEEQPFWEELGERREALRVRHRAKPRLPNTYPLTRMNQRKTKSIQRWQVP